MSENNGTAPKPTVAELRAEIKQTRAELGETVQALAAKADVKARAKEQVEHTKERVKAQAVGAATRVREAAVAAGGKVRSATDRETFPAEVEPRQSSPVPVTLIIAGVVALAGVILIIRGRRR